MSRSTRSVKAICLVAMSMAFLCLASQASAAMESITIQALIDGKSQLHLKANTAQWLNIDNAAPGRHEGVFEPTIINNAEWLPSWPDVPDSENRNCNCFSDVFDGVVPSISNAKNNFALEAIQVRGSAEIIEFPSSENEQTLIIELDDNSLSGSDAYIVNLTYDVEGFEINPGLNDAWYNPATDGQGHLVTVFPETQQMFVAWFTFDTERPFEDTPSGIGEPGHRWLIASGPYSGDTATLTIYVSEGGVFDSVNPAPVTDPAGDGTMTIEFADCTAGLVTYEITSAGLSGEIPIQRVANDNVALCENLGGVGGQ